MWKRFNFETKIQLLQDFLSYIHVTYISIFVWIKHIGWHPQHCQFNHFHPFLIGPSLSKKSGTEDDAIAHTFTLWINIGSRNRMKMVSPYSSWVFSSILDHRFLLIKKSLKLKMVGFVWFLPIKQLLGPTIVWKWLRNSPNSFLPPFWSLVPLDQKEFEKENDSIILILALETNFGSRNRLKMI